MEGTAALGLQPGQRGAADMNLVHMQRDNRDTRKGMISYAQKEMIAAAIAKP